MFFQLVARKGLFGPQGFARDVASYEVFCQWSWVTLPHENAIDCKGLLPMIMGVRASSDIFSEYAWVPLPNVRN